MLSSILYHSRSAASGTEFPILHRPIFGDQTSDARLRRVKSVEDTNTTVAPKNNTRAPAAADRARARVRSGGAVVPRKTRARGGTVVPKI